MTAAAFLMSRNQKTADYNQRTERPTCADVSQAVLNPATNSASDDEPQTLVRSNISAKRRRGNLGASFCDTASVDHRTSWITSSNFIVAAIAECLHRKDRLLPPHQDTGHGSEGSVRVDGGTFIQ